jgi:hypothetical protein
MGSEQRDRLIVELYASQEPEIGRWLWALHSLPHDDVTPE